MAWRLAPALAVLVVSLVPAAGAQTASARTPARIVYGYPYAASCPGAALGGVVDRWGMYVCNCTSYVAWTLSANHQRTDWFIRGAMDAWNWPNVALVAGLTVDRLPAAGAVAVWPEIALPFGHVAYVTGVGPGQAISVAEYNYPAPNGLNTFGFETRSYVSPGDAVFIHVPRRVNPR
ncbi:MAG TPA: CHAP domain-containing protein [Gaiellaceae bacterium]|nr:CHAP domain-containing protein [Gaiellaceae bacterium]